MPLNLLLGISLGRRLERVDECYDALFGLVGELRAHGWRACHTPTPRARIRSGSASNTLAPDPVLS
jgi:hypothetical protein